MINLKVERRKRKMVYQVLKKGKYKDFRSLMKAKKYAHKMGRGSMIWDARRGKKIAKSIF